MRTISTAIVLSLCFLITPEKMLHAQGNSALHTLFNNYYEERPKLFPLAATQNGDNRYNDLLPNDGSKQFRQQLDKFYTRYLNDLSKYNKETLNAADRISYDLLKYILQIGKEGLKYHFEYMPASQFTSLPLTLGTWGAGGTVQPFKTIEDYQHWLSRIAAFKVWADTAITNFEKGVAAGVVLPKAMVIKMIPQMENLAEQDSSKNIFYGPVRNFPESFSSKEKKILLRDYHTAITTQLIPAYQKLAAYLKNDYLPQSRTTSGYNSIPDGTEMYNYYVRFYTTTNKTPDEIYDTGIKEVARLHDEMEKVKIATGSKGSLKEFFVFLTTDSKFRPFKNSEEVLNAYRSIQQKIDPNLSKLFSIQPKTPFKIRQTEAFRAASSSAQYVSGTPDGNRPGVFYAPILDATSYTYFGMEDLFMHEAIPGHHYQVSLQREDTTLPLFRRNYSTSAFNEGWALYAETLGKELGVYTDPYQYMGFLEGQIHRAVRLVVDVSLHTGKMTREEAIRYMRNNMAIGEQAATREIERYMAIPGQALSYKIGQLKIEELRDKYKIQLGKKFSLKYFHDAVLKGGSLPLAVFENYMDEWADSEK